MTQLLSHTRWGARLGCDDVQRQHISRPPHAHYTTTFCMCLTVNQSRILTHTQITKFLLSQAERLLCLNYLAQVIDRRAASCNQSASKLHMGAHSPVDELMHDSTDKEACTCAKPAPDHAARRGVMALCLHQLACTTFRDFMQLTTTMWGQSSLHYWTKSHRPFGTIIL